LGSRCATPALALSRQHLRMDACCSRICMRSSCWGQKPTSAHSHLLAHILKVDLTARLREILSAYPEGTSLCKELLQNADDARASTMRLVLDRNSYPTVTLLDPRLAAWQGPALLAYNDAVFQKQDFESISRIGDSRKREQQGKTGRFGCVCPLHTPAKDSSRSRVLPHLPALVLESSLLLHQRDC
jgi:hypothetical protein